MAESQGEISIIHLNGFTQNNSSVKNIYFHAKALKRKENCQVFSLRQI